VAAPTDLTLSPVLLGALVGVVAVSGGQLIGAWRRGERVSPWRPAAAATAVGLLIVAWVSPVATLAAHYLLTAHLAQVTVTMGFVPPLLLLALPDAPPSRLPAVVRRAGAVAVHPAVAIVAVNVVFFAWHAPVLYQACLDHPELYSVQAVSLLLVSLAFWWAIVEPRGTAGMSPLIKLGYILLATIPQTFAGLVFALAHHTFYPGYAAAAGRVGMSPLTDQQVAGACMALVSKLALFAAFSVVLWRILDPAGVEGDAGDDGGGGPGDDRGDAPLPKRPGAPAWLGMLDAGPFGDEPAPAPRRREATPAG
jgi:putative membrane protein